MKKTMPLWLNTVLSSATTVIVMLALGLAITTWAEDSELDTGPRTIPYNGVLEFNGEPLTGAADILFTLTDDGNCVFEEEHDSVPVFAGRYSLNIGSVVGDLPVCLFNAQAIFLQMAVRGDNEETPHIQLAGRQRINPVPFAYWAAEGSDFKVDGDTIITGNVGAATANLGVFSLSGADLSIGPTQGRGDGGRAMVHDSNDRLTLNFGGDFAGGTVIGSGLSVVGDLVGGGKHTVLGAHDVRSDSGRPRLQLANNVGDGLDDFNDYQLLMWTGDTAANSFGMGIQGGTMFSNVGEASHYKFYEGGALRLHIDGTTNTTTAHGNLASTGNLTSAGNLTANGTLTVGGTVNTVGQFGSLRLSGYGVSVNGGANVVTLNASDISLNSTGGITLSGTYVRLPARASPITTCNSLTEGLMYHDNNHGGGAHSMPCVCMKIDHNHAWRQIDNVNAHCN